MNERIEKLSEQAREFVRKQMLLFQEADMSQRDAKWAELYNTKFAELIVRECANIDFRHKVGMTTDQEFETGCVILEHFGVEE